MNKIMPVLKEEINEIETEKCNLSMNQRIGSLESARLINPQTILTKKEKEADQGKLDIKNQITTPKSRGLLNIILKTCTLTIRES